MFWHILLLPCRASHLVTFRLWYQGNYSLTVHGMNQLELMANSRASQRFTRNFNEDPSLRELSEASFDAVAWEDLEMS